MDPYVHPLQLKVIKHLVYVYGGSGIQFEKFLRIRNEGVMPFSPSADP